MKAWERERIESSRNKLMKIQNLACPEEDVSRRRRRGRREREEGETICSWRRRRMNTRWVCLRSKR